MSFDSLGLSPHLLASIADSGYSTPTPIQSKAIPAIIDGADVLGAAQTGTGKTAAFVLPILQRLGQTHEKKPRVLVLAPTRELAAQVAESVSTYGANTQLKRTVVFGGVGYQPQITAFKKGVDIIVATPGRLLDHLQNGHIDLSNLNTLVLDEADRMLDMGFIHDIKRVLKYVPAQRQTLLFSATFSNDIRKLAGSLLTRPIEIDVAPRNSTAERVAQRVIMVEKPRKRAVLSHLIGSNNWSQVLVFARTKHGANRLVKQLETDGLTAAALHGNKSQNARTKALDGFKNGTVRVLVATDIAARGIDIDSLPHVVNYELPNVPEDYVHRIGRTGRAGAEGEALSLVGPEERKDLKSIEKLIGRQIERFQPEGIDLRAPQGSADTDDDDRRPARRPGNGKPSRGRPGNDNKPRADGDKSAPRQAKPHHERARHEDGSDKPRRSNTRRGKRGGRGGQRQGNGAPN
ncbi:DEAD/DEAH box helicase [Salinisphaera sp. LB1]|uniref:DEAD/DEAH box helicase n=1 Tax=Salinisphaera sp. LB1 TaxID=2183911 RepID=UPI000D707074|nr:DEAD/DEAH box helicase [Salinisphaera sp. LB1]AWN16474.1 ATP-dependent RNA helicase RhlE [Salinisphaera sp. LB1]